MEVKTHYDTDLTDKQWQGFRQKVISKQSLELILEKLCKFDKLFVSVNHHGGDDVTTSRYQNDCDH